MELNTTIRGNGATDRRRAVGRKFTGPRIGTGIERAESRLFHIACNVRGFLEPVWLEWHTARGGDIPAPLSRATCGRSSMFLSRVLRAQSPRDACTRGYFGFHAGRDWLSHAWVESGEWIVDITADQFGYEPVIVTGCGDPRYQKGVDDHVCSEFIQAHRRAVDRLWSRWLIYLCNLPAGRQAGG